MGKGCHDTDESTLVFFEIANANRKPLGHCKKKCGPTEKSVDPLATTVTEGRQSNQRSRRVP